jgi:hypothetical protein
MRLFSAAAGPVAPVNLSQVVNGAPRGRVYREAAALPQPPSSLHREPG